MTMWRWQALRNSLGAYHLRESVSLAASYAFQNFLEHQVAFMVSGPLIVWEAAGTETRERLIGFGEQEGAEPCVRCWACQSRLPTFSLGGKGREGILRKRTEQRLTL